MRLKSRNKVLIGIDDDNNIIYLEDVFWENDFKGAVGTEFEYKTESEAESLWEDAEENPTDYVDRYSWIEAAKYGENASMKSLPNGKLGIRETMTFLGLTQMVVLHPLFQRTMKNLSGII